MNREQRRHQPNGQLQFPNQSAISPAMAAQLAAQEEARRRAQSPVFNVGPMMNDVQSLAWIAALISDGAEGATAKQCVAFAKEIIVEAFEQVDDLGVRCKVIGERKQRDAEKAAAEAAAS